MRPGVAALALVLLAGAAAAGSYSAGMRKGADLPECTALDSTVSGDWEVAEEPGRSATLSKGGLSIRLTDVRQIIRTHYAGTFATTMVGGRPVVVTVEFWTESLHRPVDIRFSTEAGC
jgi:hypothetical protein